MEEWRKGWHPERIARKKSNDRVLVVGAGPAGLEAARALGQRGYEVHLAEAGAELGGRVTREARLPGLAEWARVRDWRLGRIDELQNIQVYRGNRLGAQEIIDFSAERVVLATGCHWRRDGFGRSNPRAIDGFDRPRVFTPDDVLDGNVPEGPVLLFDDDGFYLGSALAEQLARAGRRVIFVTPDESAAPWTRNTLEFAHIQKRLRELDVRIITGHNLAAFQGDRATLADMWSAKTREVDCAALLAITSRLPNDALRAELQARSAECAAAGIKSIQCIGDALAPGLIAHAVYAGHRYARELDEQAMGDVPFRRERIDPLAEA